MFALEHIVLLLQQYGYFLMFPIAIVEGPIIAIITGVLSALGTFSFFVSAVVLICGDLVGDILYYGVGRFGSKKFTNFLLRRFALTEEKFQKLQSSFHTHDAKIMLITKTQALGAVVLMLAGTLKMPFGRFLFWNTVGTIPKILVLECIGYFFGQSLTQLETYLQYTGIATFVLAIILGVFYWRFSAYLKHNLAQELEK